jgi:hypothetical protein
VLFRSGLYTAIVGGFIVSLLGGSRHQIGGPAGAFIVLVSATVARHGIDGLLLATAMAGLIFLAISLLRTVESTFNDIWGVARGRGWFDSMSATTSPTNFWMPLSAASGVFANQLREANSVHKPTCSPSSGDHVTR